VLRNTRLLFSRFVAFKQSRSQSSFGAALNSRLSTWLLFNGAKDLELVFVQREDTSNIVFELIDCLDFVNYLSPSLSCFA